MFIRVAASLVFFLMTFLGPVVWIAGGPSESDRGMFAFVAGLIGLVLSDIAFSLAEANERAAKQQASESTSPPPIPNVARLR